MPGPTGVLDRLTSEQQDQLLHWLDIYPDKLVLEKVAAPPPDGFGLATHITSLRRFQARKERDASLEILEIARAAAAESASTKNSSLPPDVFSLKKPSNSSALPA